MDDMNLMKECLEEAQRGQKQEVAIGCVFFHKMSGKIIARSRNTVNATKNATRHAELNCIDQTIAWAESRDIKVDQTFWSDVIVAVTCEPCIMCARLMRHLEIGRTIYGCSNDRFGGCKSVINIATSDTISEKPLNFEAGHNEFEAIELLREFYEGENMNAPEPKRRKKQ